MLSPALKGLCPTALTTALRGVKPPVQSLRYPSFNSGFGPWAQQLQGIIELKVAGPLPELRTSSCLRCRHSASSMFVPQPRTFTRLRSPHPRCRSLSLTSLFISLPGQTHPTSLSAPSSSVSSSQLPNYC